MRNELKKSFMILMVFLVLIISISAISASDDVSTNETLAINDIDQDQTLEDPVSIEIITEQNKTFTDLNNDIAGNTEINMDKNYVYTSGDSAYANGITVNKEVTINGNGKTIDSNGSLLFKIGTDGKLTLNDMTIVNSYTSPDAMIQNSGTLILNNVTFTVERHILSSVSSGAKFTTIQNDGEMTVKDSTFKDSYIYSDHISSTSKQISIYGLIYNTNTTTIENTIFDNNKIYNPSDVKLGRTIDICAILHNTNNMLLKNVIIQNTNVSYTPAGNNHFEGIVFNEKGKLEINGSIIRDNAIAFTTTNTNFKGVVYSEATNSELTISNSIIMDNKNINQNTEKAIIEYKGTATLDNNYWGTNTPNFSSLITGTAPANFAVLGFTPENATTGEEKTFEITLTATEGIMPEYNVVANSEKLGATVVEIKNGVGQYKYLPISAGEDTITINGEEYTINVTAAPAGTFTELNSSIANNNEINLYKNYTYVSGDSALQTGIVIDKEVVINGNGYTISSSASALFNIATNGKLTLRNVTLLADYALDSPTSKGNIVNNGILNLDEVTITSLKTNTKAIAATILNKGTLNINNSRLVDSVSNYTGATTSHVPYGFIYNYQAATTTIENTIISNNEIETNGKMPSANGLIYNYRGNLNLNNVNFTDNIIKESSTANTGTTNLYGLIYSTNYQDNGKLIIDNCNFENTKIISATGLATSKFISVIYSISGNNEMKISNSRFINNTFESDHGGLYGAIYTSTQFTSSNNIFENNGGKESSAIYATNILTSQNDIFRGNNANNVIYTTKNATITDSILENNIVTGYVIYNTAGLNANNNYWGTNNPDFATLIKNGTPDNYATISIVGETSLLPESVATYTVNFMTNDTNAICELPDYVVDLSATNKLSDASVTITKGSASFTYTSTLEEITDTIKASVDSQEKATLAVTVSEDPTAKGTYRELDRFVRKANGELDLIKDYTFDALIDSGLENGIVINKTLVINGHGFKISSADLAKLFDIQSTGNLTLKDVVLVSDNAKTGAYNSIRPEASIKNLGILTFDNVTFTINQNTASADNTLAAGIYNAKTLEIINSKFVNSNISTSTQRCFGLIDNNGGTIKIKDTLFDNNSIVDNSTMSTLYFNGLIYNMGTLTFDNVNVTNNYMKTPTNSRGLIRGYTNSKITIDNSRFEDNTVNSTDNNAPGNVIYAEDGTLTITNSQFIKNTGARSGGVLYASVSPTIINNTFEKNTATENGGAIYLASGASQPVFINNIFKENKAINGGALYSSNSLQSNKAYNFTANTFIANEATKNGGAVYAASIGSNTYPIESNVFTNNKAIEKGGAIYSTGTLKITKTIFKGNEAGEGAVIYTTGSSASAITYSIFDNNDAKAPTGTLIYYPGSSTVENNYWGTNTPDFGKIIAVKSGTLTPPTNIVILNIEGNETLTASDDYIIRFVDNVTGDVVDKLPEYAFNLTSNINSVTPSSIVITGGETVFTYNAENNGADTIKVLSDNDEKAAFDLTVDTRKTPQFSIVAEDVAYGDELNFTFTITEGPSGSDIYKWTIFSQYGLQIATGYIDSETKEINYTETLSAGTYKIVVSTADVEGWHDFEANDTFEITSKDVTVNPTVTVNDDNSVTIAISIEADGQIVPASGNINTNIGCNGSVENGQTTINTEVLAPGTYDITFTYTGDGNYKEATNTATVVIKNLIPEDALNTTTPKVNESSSYSISLPSDATGNLTVCVDGQNYTQALENGTATVTIPELTPGKHNITVTYSGDKNYSSMSQTEEISLKNPTTEKSLEVKAPQGTDSPSYTISLPSDATGNLTVTVDGVNYTQALENGTATVTIPKLAPGEHNITVTYSGDENYESISKTTILKTEDNTKTNTTPQANTPAKAPEQTTTNVAKKASKITAKKKTFKASKKVKKYTITLKSGKKPIKKVQVTLKIKGKTYKAKTNAKGKATFKIKKLTKKGKYTAVIKFKGNKDYQGTSKKVKIVIK